MTSRPPFQIQISNGELSRLHAVSDHPPRPMHLHLTPRSPDTTFSLPVRFVNTHFVHHRQDNPRSDWDHLSNLLQQQDDAIKAYLTGPIQVNCRVASADAAPPYDGLHAVELRYDEGNKDKTRSRRQSAASSADTEDSLPTPRRPTRRHTNRVDRPPPVDLPPRPRSHAGHTEKPSLMKAIKDMINRQLQEERHQLSRSTSHDPRHHRSSRHGDEDGERRHHRSSRHGDGDGDGERRRRRHRRHRSVTTTTVGGFVGVEGEGFGFGFVRKTTEGRRRRH